MSAGAARRFDDLFAAQPELVERYTQVEIARMIDCSQPTVARLLAKRGLRLRGRYPTLTDPERLERMRDAATVLAHMCADDPADELLRSAWLQYEAAIRELRRVLGDDDGDANTAAIDVIRAQVAAACKLAADAEDADGTAVRED